MIKRIKTIKNVGMFIDCKAGGCEFGKETLIYAKNTSGKSTFTDIFRSLRDGNNELIVGRKTFGQSGNQKIEIMFEDDTVEKLISFDGNRWNECFKEIMIFDSKFINKNVYTGDNISFNHQENMNQIIIGEKGKKIKVHINKIQKKLEELSNEKRQKTIEFSNKHSNFKIDEFLNLSKIDQIEKVIEDKNKEIKLKKESEKIVKLLSEKIIGIKNLKFIDFKNVFEKCIEIAPEEIEKHIKNNWSDPSHSKHFLQEGYNLLKKEIPQNCAFCGQELSENAKKLVNIYGEYFKGKFEEIQKKVQNRGEKFKKWNLENYLTKLDSELKSFDIKTDFIEDRKLNIISAKNNFDDEVSRKQMNLNYSIDFTQLNFIEQELNTIEKYLKDIKNEILKKSTEKNTFELEEDKKHLAINKERYDGYWIKFCNELENIKQGAEKLRIHREKMRDELDEFSLDIFTKYENRINYYCDIMGADFKLINFKPLKKIKGQNERIFAIRFFKKYDINLDNTYDKKPNFKNTVSESDKRLLAFAFFLSLLSADKNLEKKIIIFDDPISSFDEERKRKTKHLLSDICHRKIDELGKEIKHVPIQKIILTHDIDFLTKLYRDNFSSFRTLKIINDGDQNNVKKCKLAHCNVQDEFLEPECINKIKRLMTLKNSNKEIEDTEFYKDCREIMEHIFKRKYYHELEELIIKKKSIRSFTQKLRELKINNFDNDDKFKLFIRLCNDLHIELHDNNNQKSTGDIKSILNDFFICLKVI